MSGGHQIHSPAAFPFPTAFVYPEDWIEHLTWASMLLFILTRGPGAISLDHFLRKALKLS